MTAPRFIVGSRPDHVFQAAVAKAQAAMLRCSLAKAVQGDFTDLEPYLALLPAGLPVHVALVPFPAPAGVPTVTIDGQDWPQTWAPEFLVAWQNGVDNLLAYLAAQSRPLHGLRLCLATVSGNDAELGWYGYDKPAAVKAWADAGWRPDTVLAAVCACAMDTYRLGVRIMSLPILDPRQGGLPIAADGTILDKPDEAFSNSVVQAALTGVGGTQGVIAPMDLNLGLHPLSTFVQAAATDTGIMAVQLHVTVTGADVPKWLDEAEDCAPAWVELHQDQASAL